MYAGVPAARRALVGGASPSSSRAMPKSTTTSRSPSIRMFAGFRSAWTIPRRSSSSIASTSCRRTGAHVVRSAFAALDPIARSSPSVLGVVSDPGAPSSIPRYPRRFGPSTSSITIAARLGSTQSSNIATKWSCATSARTRNSAFKA
ncbi:MAG: hypothetical protein U0271_06465 [Polyangiaceae bacterium]